MEQSGQFCSKRWPARDRSLRQRQAVEVAASIVGQTGAPVEIALQFVNIPPADTAGQFAGVWTSPPPRIYEITVYAYQKATGNTGVDTATVIVPSLASS